MRNFIMAVMLFVAGSWLAGPARSEKSGTEKETARHQLVQLALEKGAFRVVRVTSVSSPLKIKRGRPLAHETWRLTVNGKKGEQLYQGWISDPRWVQAELDDPDRPGEAVHAHALLPEPVEFAVRVPDAPRARLTFEMLLRDGDRQSMQLLGSVELPEGQP